MKVLSYEIYIMILLYDAMYEQLIVSLQTNQLCVDLVWW